MSTKADAVSAIKALHRKTTWTFHRYNAAADDFGGDPYDKVPVVGCAECGGRTQNETFWPCRTVAVIEAIENDD